VVIARAERRLSLTDKEFIQMESACQLIRNGIKSLSVVE
jgi:hypothetical protein